MSGEHTPLEHDLLALAYQYRNDLQFPVSPDSRARRLAAIDAAIFKATGASKGEVLNPRLPACDEELAFMLCVAHGQDPHKLTYHSVEPGVVEPYGDLWTRYLEQAANLRAALPAAIQKARG